MTGTIHLPSAATEADIIRAIADLPAGGTVVLPENKTITIRSGLQIDVAHRNITLDLNGSMLRKAGDVSVVTGLGESGDAVSVRLGANAAGNTIITYAELPAGLAAGDWVKIVSDDKLPGDRFEGNLSTRMGQAMEVLRVDGKTVTFKGALIDQSHYDTNVRASAYSSGELVVKNGEIVGEQSHALWNKALVQLRSVVDAQVEDLTVRDGIGRGVQVVDSINAEITDLTARNFLDGGSAALAIAVSSVSSIGTTVQGLYAEKVTHAADNNAIGTVPNSRHIQHYGGDIGMDVSDSVAVGTRNFAWSWHSESVDGTFDNVMAFDSYGFLMGRGIGGEMTNSGGAGNGRGIILYEYGDNDARNITIDHVILKETLNYSIFAANDPLYNRISHSIFEAFGPGNLASAPQVAVNTTAFVRAGLDSNDVIAGSAGDNLLLGGKGADEISAGAGNDYIWGGTGADSLTGGYGSDRFAFHSLSEASDVITDFYSGIGGDVLDLAALAAKYGWDRDHPIENGYLRFVQTGADVRVQVDGNGGGNDFMTLATLKNIHSSQLGAGNLRLSLSGAAGPAPAADPETTLRGTEGADVLRGSIDTDHIIGAGGFDKLTASIGDTLLEGGSGDDGISGNRGNDVLKGGTGQDLMSGGDGRDRLYGEAGNDMLLGGAGADALSGGAGYDTANYTNSASGVAVDVLSARGSGGNAAGDSYSSIENLTGSDFNDVLSGNQAANLLEGGAGNDKLSGRQGADMLRGGLGADWLDGGTWKDVLTGGIGADSFYFASVAQAGDTVTDFQTGVDHLVLSRTGFGIEGFSFVVGVEATSANATLLCDRNGGKLLWDADGTGAQDVVLLANISGLAHFSQSDIWIV